MQALHERHKYVSNILRTVQTHTNELDRIVVDVVIRCIDLFNFSS
jgi:hypothetical protein